MRILVTGGAGFIGRHTCNCLLENGHEVIVVDNFSTGRPEWVAGGARVIEADITAPDLTDLTVRLQPDAVVHLAAQTSVSQSVSAPHEDAHTNIVGTVNVLRAAAAAGVRRLVFASSAAVYGEPESLPLKEDARAEPLSPYGLSKQTGEAYIRMVTNAHGISYTILRFSNVYGPGQTADGEAGVVAIFCDKAMRGEAPTIHGDGAQTRDFVYVGDVAEAVRLALESDRPADTFNVSTGDPVSVLGLWGEIRRAMAELVPQMPVSEPRLGPERPGDIRHSYLDHGQIRTFLGWEPRVALPAGLVATLRGRLPDGVM